MLKGHLQIELKNEKTGQVEVHEQDNMVTDAVAKVLGLCANGGAISSSSNALYSMLPIAKKALGGLFLFDGKLEEKADNIHFPMNVHLTGCAGRESSAGSPLVGSLDATETKELDSGYTNVWNFSTSQANGTIASLTLTHYLAGASPFVNTKYAISRVNEPNYYHHPIAYDVNKGILYTYRSGKIYAQKVFTDIIRANSPSFGAAEVVFDFAFSKSKTESAWTVCNGHDGYLYAIYIPYQYSVGTATVEIRKIKISDASFVEEDITFSVDNVAFAGSAQGSSSSETAFDTGCAISKGKLYALENGKKKLYKINLANTVDIESFEFDKYTVTYICPMFNGGLFACFSWTGVNASSGATEIRHRPGVIYSDGEYRCIEDGYSTNEIKISSYMTTEADNLMTGQGGSSNTFTIYYTQNYLGTICNLSSPVTKTSAQSMKITYTLTDA